MLYIAGEGVAGLSKRSERWGVARDRLAREEGRDKERRWVKGEGVNIHLFWAKGAGARQGEKETPGACKSLAVARQTVFDLPRMI